MEDPAPRTSREGAGSSGPHREDYRRWGSGTWARLWRCSGRKAVGPMGPPWPWPRPSCPTGCPGLLLSPAQPGQNPGGLSAALLGVMLPFYRGPSCSPLPSVQAAWLAPTHTQGALTS